MVDSLRMERNTCPQFLVQTGGQNMLLKRMREPVSKPGTGGVLSQSPSPTHCRRSIQEFSPGPPFICRIHRWGFRSEIDRFLCMAWLMQGLLLWITKIARMCGCHLAMDDIMLACGESAGFFFFIKLILTKAILCGTMWNHVLVLHHPSIDTFTCISMYTYLYLMTIIKSKLV